MNRTVKQEESGMEKCAPESLEASSRNGGREMENRQGERRTFAGEQTMLGEGNHQRVREMR